MENNHQQLFPGDLVSIEPWDCEGIENPWGRDRSNASFTTPRQARKTKIKVGSLGVIVSRSDSSDDPDNPDYPGYKVLVNERYLDVHFHFLNKVKI